MRGPVPSGTPSRARRSVRAAVLVVAAVVLGLGIVLATQVENQPSFTGGRLVGQRAPAFAGTMLDGTALASTDLAGRSVIVNFWNDWCIPCHRELPALTEFHARHRDDPDVVLVGIVRDMRRESDIRDYVEVEGIDWPVVFDPDGRAALDFATTGQPETFAIAPDGEVVAWQAGEVSTAGLEQMLAAARGL